MEDVIAHLADDGRVHCLNEHLSETAKLAAAFAGAFGCAEWGRLAGEWHDLGKYSDEFQQYIRGTGPRTDHSSAGAIQAVEQFGTFGRVVAYLIAGHHAGLEESGLPDGLSTDADEDNNAYSLTVAADADKKEIKEWLKEAKPSKPVKDAINAVLKDAKSRKPSGEEVEKGRDKMCQDYYDIRTFGGVLSLKSAPNCGQVRGPIQLTFARSIDQIVPLEHSITRMAVATEAEAEKQQGDNRTMGRKFTVPYALYRCHGFISAPLAAQTGFSEDDLELFWQSVINMFEHDRSAARGQMATRKLIVFKHEGKMGNAPAHKLFDMVKVAAADGPVREFDASRITVPIQSSMPSGVTVIEKL